MKELKFIGRGSTFNVEEDNDSITIVEKVIEVKRYNNGWI